MSLSVDLSQNQDLREFLDTTIPIFFSTKFSSTKVKSSLETLMEEIKPVSSEKFEFEDREIKKASVSFGNFGFSKLRPME